MNKDTIELLNTIADELEKQASIYNRAVLGEVKDDEMSAASVFAATSVCRSLSETLRRVATLQEHKYISNP